MSRPLLSRALVVFGTALLLATGLGCGQVDAGAGEDVLPTTVTVPGPVTTPVPVTVAPTTTIRLPKGTMFISEDGRFRVQLRTRPRRTENTSGGVRVVLYGSGSSSGTVLVGSVEHPRDSAELKDPDAFLRDRSTDEADIQMSETTFLGRLAVDTVRRRPEEGVIEYRFQRAFLVENRMYLISAFSTSEAPPSEYPAALATFTLL